MRFIPLFQLGALIVLACKTSFAVEVSINTDLTHQTISGFGASITGNSEVRVPLYQSDAFRDFVAYELGLSVLRMQIDPAVSTEEIANYEEISYSDFNAGKDSGASITIDFARALIDRDPSVRVIGSAWSPPGWMKENGRTHGTRSGFILDRNRGYDDDNRLRDDRYDHYAKFLVEYTKMLEARGTPLYGISPQNELMFTQYFDSAMYTGEEYARIVRKLGQRFEAEGLQRPLIFGPEDMTQAVYNPGGSGVDGTRHNPYVDNLMAPGTAEYFDVWATHGYTDGVNSGGSQDPGRYWERIKQFGRPYWITEGGTGGHEWPTPITSGIAAYLHYALVNANVELFTAWQVQDPVPSTHSVMAWDTPTKKTYAAMHYWRFVRPGFKRVDANFVGLSGSLRVSAYKDPSGERLVVVAINPSSSPQSLDISITGAVEVDSFQAFQTTASSNLKYLGPVNVNEGKVSVQLPGYSITTLAELQPLQSITLDRDSLQLERGLREKLTPLLSPADATNRRLTWTSSDPDIAVVDGGGWITGISEGHATITAVADDGGHEASAVVQVLPRTSWEWVEWEVANEFSDTGTFLGWLYIPYQSDWVYSYAIDAWLYLPERNVMGQYAWLYFIDSEAPMPTETVGATSLLEVSAVKSAAQHTNVAVGKSITYSAASDGSPGEGLIDGDTSTSEASRWSVEVYPQWALIDLQGMYEISQFRLYPLENRGYAYKIETSQDGETYQLTVDKQSNRQGGQVLSDNVDVIARYVLLTITGSGGYGGGWISIGEFQIIGAEAVVPVGGVQLSHSTISRGVGQTWRLSATVIPEFASNKEVSWSSSDESVAVVDSDGRLAAIGEGTTTVTVTTEDGGFTASAEVVVGNERRWSRWLLDEGDFVDTGSFAGALYVDPQSGWVYSYPLSAWIYLPEEQIYHGGSWGLLVR